MSSATPSIEARLREIEDRLEIYTLIAAHPPSADTGAAFYSSYIYLEDGEFDRGESLPGAVGNEAIGAFLRTEEHQAAINGGLAHFAGLPHIELQGDTAFVTSYLQIITPDAKGEPRELSNHGVSTGFRIHRVLANRWTLQRTPEGWRIKSRKRRRAAREHTDRFVSLGHTLNGWAALNQLLSLEAARKARGSFEAALRLDAHNVSALLGLANAHMWEVNMCVSHDREARIRVAEAAAAKALEMNPNTADVHVTYRTVLFAMRAPECALREFELAVSLDGNLAFARLSRADEVLS